MVRFNSDVVFIDMSGQVRAIASDLTLRANESGGGHIIVGSGVSLRPENNCDALDAIDLGQESHRWDTIYACSGNFLERPTVNGSGVLLEGEVVGGGAASGVTLLNGLFGVIDIVGVSGIDVSTSGQNILVGINPSGLTTIIQDVGFSGLFNSVFSEAIENQTTNSLTFVQALRLQTPAIPSGTYRIAWSLQASADQKDEEVEYRVEVDDSIELMLINPSFNLENQALQFGGFTHQFLSSGTHTIDLDFRNVEATDFSSSVDRARIDMWRIS